MGKTLGITLLFICVLNCLLSSCSTDKPPVAPAVTLRDSIPVMTSYGVSKMISDSGVIRYKVVTEEWSVYDRTSPTKQTFMKGILLEKFNEKFHIEMYITADTAFWYNQELWELRGRVCVWNEGGTVFNSELLYWDMNKHEFYSNKFSHLVTPDREVDGHSFHSNEQMTEYEVNFSHAIFPVPGEDKEENTSPTTENKSEEASETPEPEKPKRDPMTKSSLKENAPKRISSTNNNAHHFRED